MWTKHHSIEALSPWTTNLTFKTFLGFHHLWIDSTNAPRELAFLNEINFKTFPLVFLLCMPSTTFLIESLWKCDLWSFDSIMFVVFVVRKQASINNIGAWPFSSKSGYYVVIWNQLSILLTDFLFYWILIILPWVWTASNKPNLSFPVSEHEKTYSPNL